MAASGIRTAAAVAAGIAASLVLTLAQAADTPKPKAAAPAAAGGGDKDKAIIEYREHIMKSLNEQSGALGQILSGAAPDTHVQEHLQSIALAASIALKAFEPKVQGGEAKPEVWSNWPDFQKRMKEFADKTAEMAKVGKEQGKDAALGLVVDALSCKSCHDTYRAEKKK